MSRALAALLVTTHPVAPPWDSADKHIAAAILRHADGTSLTYFGRAGQRVARTEGARRLPMVSLHGKPAAAELFQAALLGTLLQPGFDLVHAVISVGPGFGRLVRAWRLVPRRFRPPMIHTAPGIANPAAFASRDERTVVVALSERSASVLRSAGAREVVVIEPGIDLRAWPLLEPARQERTTVLFAGHCDRDGGLDTAIDGVAAAQRRGEDVELLLALRHRPGRSAAREQQEARARAAAAGLDRVEVHGENAPMPELIGRASLVVLPGTRLHGKADVPLVVLESLASGRPVVLGDLPEFEALGDAVVRIPAGDPEALGTAIAELAAAPADGGEVGRRLVERRYSEAAMAAAYLALYARVAEEFPRRRQLTS